MGVFDSLATEHRSRALFLHRFVVVADDASDHPLALLVVPDVNELRFTHVGGVSGMVKSMNTDLDGAVVGQGEHFEASNNEFSRNLAAGVVLDALDKHLFADGESGFVVVELQIVGNQGRHGGQVAVVVGVEELGIQRARFRTRYRWQQWTAPGLV
jgi:hypothetical protein